MPVYLPITCTVLPLGFQHLAFAKADDLLLDICGLNRFLGLEYSCLCNRSPFAEHCGNFLEEFIDYLVILELGF